MASVYAEWDVGTFTVRKDTRVYFLDSTTHDQEQRNCVGTIWMCNPGTKYESGSKKVRLKTSLRWGRWPGSDLDETIKIIVAVIEEAKRQAALHNRVMGQEDYVEVLNLFYLCESERDKALKQLRRLSPYCESPCQNPRFSWLAWGDDPPAALIPPLNSLKNPFFYSLRDKCLIRRTPTNHESALHPWASLPRPELCYQQLIAAYISSLL